MVKVIIGNIFESKAQTLVNTVNCVGVMGKGLALEFRNRFPDMYKDYVLRCERGNMKLGRPYLFRRTVLPWVLLFPTKQDWRSVSCLADIEEGLRYLQLNYRDWGITSIAVPPLGCGLGELEWHIVGKALYRGLKELAIPVELFAPYGTPDEEMTAEFLGEISEAQRVEMSDRKSSRIESGFFPIIEVLRRLEQIPYHHPIGGRTAFQKIAYFGTMLGLKTGLKFERRSFGPFASRLKSRLTRLVNNGLIAEEQHGRMFMIRVGETFKDASKLYKDEIQNNDKTIDKLTDLFCRLNTKQAEVAGTVHFAWKSIDSKETPSEEKVLDEVMIWKKRHKPSYNRLEVAKAIRNLAIHGWLEVKPSISITKEIESASAQ